MLRRSLAGQSHTEVHADELSRGGVSYSIDTVKAFKARHAGNIAKGKMSAAYWADKVKW